MSNSIISIKNLEKTFLGVGEPLTILKDLDMEIEAGTKSIILAERTKLSFQQPEHPETGVALGQKSYERDI